MPTPGQSNRGKTFDSLEAAERSYKTGRYREEVERVARKERREGEGTGVVSRIAFPANRTSR